MRNYGEIMRTIVAKPSILACVVFTLQSETTWVGQRAVEERRIEKGFPSLRLPRAVADVDLSPLPVVGEEIKPPAHRAYIDICA